jgi:hypothetical protein
MCLHGMISHADLDFRFIVLLINALKYQQSQTLRIAVSTSFRNFEIAIYWKAAI